MISSFSSVGLSGAISSMALNLHAREQASMTIYFYYLTEPKRSCHQKQRNLALNYVVSIKRRLMLLMVQNRRCSTLIPRRDPGENDVQIEILFCGICHTDLHIVRNEWSAVRTVYPCVPGHEIVGRVTKVGSGVTKFKPGDLAAVGCWLTPTVIATSARPALSSSAPT